MYQNDKNYSLVKYLIHMLECVQTKPLQNQCWLLVPVSFLNRSGYGKHRRFCKVAGFFLYCRVNIKNFQNLIYSNIR